MSSDIYEKSWALLSDEEDEEYREKVEKDIEMKRRETNVLEGTSSFKNTASNPNVTKHETLLEGIKPESVSQCESQSLTNPTDKAVKQETDSDIISKFIKDEKEIKVQDSVLKKYIKQDSSDDIIDDMFLIVDHPLVEEPKKIDKAVVEIKTEIKTEVNVEGAEDEWAAFAEPTEKSSAPNRPTFAQICAKNATPAPFQASVQISMVSPTKKQRKRSLFPEASCDSKKDIFGILEENSVDSPSKDIRKIMSNIHMDSPLRNDCEIIDKTSSHKKAVAIRRDLMDDSSKPIGLRKRSRDPTKTSGSPAPKMPHYSERKDSPARKSKGIETDKATLARRQKQIDYGKNTKGYDNYMKMVPKEKREAIHPKTPPKHLVYSRRAWDGLIKVWRQKLHFWDSPADGGSGGIGSLPESWDSLSEASLSVSNSDEMSDKSLPTTPQADRRRARKTSDDTVNSVD